MAGEAPILFYDGDCGLCARSVRLMLRHDRRGTLRFAPLRGETYRALPNADKPTDLNTMVLLEDGRLYTRSDAWARVMKNLGGAWSVVGALVGALPQGFRDAAYGFIARRRHAWFARADACSQPTPAQRARFLA